MEPALLSLVPSVIISLLIWLLKNKDAAQSKEIEDLRTQHAKDLSEVRANLDLLFRKHDLDVVALQELRVLIASNHYERNELDKKFDKIEIAFSTGFSVLGSKFDKLAETLVSHIINEDIKRK